MARKFNQTKRKTILARYVDYPDGFTLIFDKPLKINSDRIYFLYNKYDSETHMALLDIYQRRVNKK